MVTWKGITSKLGTANPAFPPLVSWVLQSPLLSEFTRCVANEKSDSRIPVQKYGEYVVTEIQVLNTKHITQVKFQHKSKTPELNPGSSLICLCESQQVSLGLVFMHKPFL